MALLMKVYPRPCGETRRSKTTRYTVSGLSPPVRGNRHPNINPGATTSLTLKAERSFKEGLSPPVRGNPLDAYSPVNLST